MTLRFVDSFDHYSTDELNRKWTNVVGSASQVNISSDSPRNGAGNLKVQAATKYVTKIIDNQASWRVGFGFKVETIIGSMALCNIADSGTIQVGLYINTDGTLEVKRGGAIATSGTSITGGKSILTLSVGIWYHVEFKVTISNSIGAGSCVVKVNGVTFLTVATGQDTQQTANAFANGIYFGVMGGFSANFYHYDDVYICDGAGSTNNDLLGDCRVEARFPNGNGNVSDYLGSDADSVDNYLHVDETPPDDDTTYVEDSTPGNQDLYTVENLSVTPDTIFGVQTNFMAKKDDAGARSVKNLIRSGVTTYDGDTNALSDGDYANFEEIYEENPDTAAAWTESNFNSAEFGIETV